MVWKLMNCQLFAKKLNVLRNNIPDQLMESYDQVKPKLYLLSYSLDIFRFSWSGLITVRRCGRQQVLY